jgi:peptide deformylase
MSVKEILMWPEVSLSRKSHNVEKITDDVMSLVSDMTDTMRASNGLGLAAPQIGVNKKIFVLDMEKMSLMEEVEYDDDVLAVINPKIVDGFGEITIQEGCLSIPGEMFFVQRAPFITVEYQDVTGQINTLSASGIVSIAIQHEIDHLDGILLVDNVGRERKQLILETVSSRSDEEGDLYTVYGGD